MRVPSGLPALICALALCHPVARAEETGRITFLISGEQMGRLSPCGCTEKQIGGLARRAPVISRIRNDAHGDLVVLDNGGLVAVGGRQQEIKYSITMLALEEMGYDAIGVGVKDLAIGLSTIEAQAQGWSFDVLSSNLQRKDGTYPFKRWRVVTLASGRKVGVFALLGRAFEVEVERTAVGVEVVDPVAVAREAVQALQGQSDVVVLLSHAPIEETREIIRSVEGINLAVTGYLVEKPLDQAERVGRTTVVGTGLQGKWLVKLDLELDADGATARGYEAIHLSGEFGENEEIVALLEDYRLQVAEEDLIDKVPRAPMGDLSYLGSHACLRCHRRQFKKWETVLHATAMVPLEESGYDRDPECVVCHVVGLHDEGGFESPTATPDLASVGCEACHAAGSRHLSNVLAPYTRPDETKCRSCHDPDNSPNFDFDKYFPKIDHRNKTLKALPLTEEASHGKSDRD